jgi:hypothetical protein
MLHTKSSQVVVSFGFILPKIISELCFISYGSIRCIAASKLQAFVRYNCTSSIKQVTLAVTRHTILAAFDASAPAIHVVLEDSSICKTQHWQAHDRWYGIE